MRIDYYFTFEDGVQKAFNINLNPQNLEIIIDNMDSIMPEWTRISNCRCLNCTFNEEISAYCPIALNIREPIEFFRDYTSYDKVEVLVITGDRSYGKKTTIQNSLSSLLGIYMVASGCPSMEKLKPMVRFHLPFATVEETLFRAAGSYLLGQYFLHQQGKKADMELIELAEFYNGIHQVNRGIAERIRGVVGKDAINNAVVCLDMFAKELPYAIDENLEELKLLFNVYWNN